MLPRALPPSEHTILSIAKGDRTSLQLQVGGAVLLPCIVTRTEMTLRGLRVERNSIWFWNRWFGAGDSFEPVIYSSQWFVRASDLFESVICFQWFVCFQKEPIPSGRRKKQWLFIDGDFESSRWNTCETLAPMVPGGGRSSTIWCHFIGKFPITQPHNLSSFWQQCSRPRETIRAGG